MAKYLQIDGGYFFVISVSNSNLFGSSRNSLGFWNDVSRALFVTTFAGLLMALLFLKITKNLEQTREIRAERLQRGWRWRINNNFRVFLAFGLVFIAIHLFVNFLFSHIIYSWWQYLLISLLFSAINGIFFTITTAILDLRAQKLSNS